jgi:Protein  of unknown function (DUF3018)
MATSTNERVRKSRDALRAQGLRPVQIWMQDTRSAEFKAEMARQSAVIAAAEADDEDLWAFMDAAAADLLGSIDD